MKLDLLESEGERPTATAAAADAGSAGKADAYARLLAVLATADAEALPPVTAPVVLIKRTERGEIGRRWEDVEGFRSFFRAQPAG